MKWLYMFSFAICATIFGMDCNNHNQKSTFIFHKPNTIYDYCFYKEAQKYFIAVSDEELTNDFLTVIHKISLSDDDRRNFARVIVYMGHAAQSDNAEDYVRYYNFLNRCVSDAMNGTVLDHEQWKTILPQDEIRRKTI